MTDLSREQIVALLEDDYVSAERAVVDSILRQLLATLDALAAAQAAQAGVVREACEAVSAGYAAWAAKPHNAKWVRRIDGTPIPNDLLVCIQTAIRSLADPTGVALLAELRAERDRLNDECDRHCDATQEADGLRWNAEAERDRLAAANAALEAKVAGLVDALNAISVFVDFRGFNEMEPTPAAKIARAALATLGTESADTPDADTAAIRHHERFGPLDEHGNPLDPRRRG